MNTTTKLMTEMKKTLLISFLALLGMTQAAAQEYEYVPFVREGVKWTYYITDYQYHKDYITNPARGDNVAYRTLEIKGDTVINGLTYKKMHKYSGETINAENDTVPVYLREENKKVYAFVPEFKFYDDCYVGNWLTFSEVEATAIRMGQEFLLYDFEDAITYWESFDNEWTLLKPLSVDTITVGNHLVKRYKDQNNRFTIIEGIGATGMNSYPLGFFMPLTTGIHTTEYYGLEKVVEDGEVIYPENLDRYMPFIREGVKWVNERVTVNNGDTTCCYYTYEFKGNHPEKFGYYGLTCKALYRYEGDHHAIDVDNDSIVAALRENDAMLISYCNEPLSQVYSQDMNMIDFGSLNQFLYKMAIFDTTMQYCKDYYMLHQREQVLNDENLVTLEPMIIDGYRCGRMAYLDEQGDTLALVVEGIGFDSRDMGDLLTPFTRRPDPTADHQEWCGLSHVIKDGKIIYKGMRYNPNAIIVIPGDVNGDGEVNIGDANSVIDIVVMGGNNGHTRIPAADLNGDGEVTIADFNAIIDIILGQQIR